VQPKVGQAMVENQLKLPGNMAIPRLQEDEVVVRVIEVRIAFRDVRIPERKSL